jgi:hypothetical protein
MSLKEKLLMLGILVTIAAAFAASRYCPCIGQFLQRFVA